MREGSHQRERKQNKTKVRRVSAVPAHLHVLTRQFLPLPLLGSAEARLG